MIEETLGKRISAHRKKLGMTQDTLAEQLGVTAQAVSKWENDQSCPDISMLPKLTEIFGISIDELLGVERKREAMQNPAPEQEEPAAVPQEMPGRKMGIGIALWLLLAGGVLLAAEIPSLHLPQISVWQTICLAGLTVFGLFGLYPRFSVFRLGCALCGGYYFYCMLAHPVIQLTEELLIPLLLIFFGLGLLLDCIRGKKMPIGHKDWREISRNSFHCDSNSFSCQTCFGESHRMIRLAQLENGSAEVMFGELSVDIRDCQSVAQNCCIGLKCDFGSLTLCAPRRWQLQCINKTAFGTVQEYGSPDLDAEGTIRLECDVRFGEISIKYV